ncbi:MAG: 4Fe-4S binding protein [Desulfobulbus sp.]|jgi:ferredoxin-type protein NapH|uniref:4Fe-4S binding protein n=1 Tax=Desulfobulbus sp. TaxID=895 RepID=UPI00284E41EE|nr:4Fe-4S binding protein [Desulfobulbus sp.]MDR2549915.1 4Fe-4S binding protein [Desulfobulbus sp.]
MKGTALESPPKSSDRSLRTMRRCLLAAAFLLLILTPLLNYYAGITFIQGWYQSLGIGELRLISPLEGLESILVSRQIYVPVLIGMLAPLVLAALLGRVFCSWVCPISFLAEAVATLRAWIMRKKRFHDRLVLGKRLLWYALVGELLLSLVLGAPLFVFLSPPGLVGRELMLAVYSHRLAWEGILVVGIVVLELLTRRFYCRYFCPLGALLALVGAKRRLVVAHRPDRCTGCARCAQACPLGLRPELGETRTAYCWNCGTCIESCPDRALQFTWQTSTLPLSNEIGNKD